MARVTGRAKLEVNTKGMSKEEVLRIFGFIVSKNERG